MNEWHNSIDTFALLHSTSNSGTPEIGFDSPSFARRQLGRYPTLEQQQLELVRHRDEGGNHVKGLDLSQGLDREFWNKILVPEQGEDGGVGLGFSVNGNGVTGGAGEVDLSGGLTLDLEGLRDEEGDVEML